MGAAIGGIKLPNLGGWVNDRKKEAAAWVKDPGKEAGKTLAGAGKALVGESVKTLNNAKAWVKDPGAEAGKTLKRVGARVDRENKKTTAAFKGAVDTAGNAVKGVKRTVQNKASEGINNAKAWAKDPGKEASKTLDRTGKNLLSDAKQTAKNAKAWAKDPGKETSKTLERFQQTGIKLLNKLDKEVVGTLIKASQPDAKKTGPSKPPQNIRADSKLAQAEKRLNDYSSQYEKKAEGKAGVQKFMDGFRKIANEGYGDDQFKNIGKSKEELAALKTKVRDGSMTQAQADQASLAIVKKFNTEEKRVTKEQGNNAEMGKAVHGAGRVVVIGGAAVLATGASGGNIFVGAAAAAGAGSLYDAASEMDKGSSAIAPKLDNSNSLGGVAVKAARGEKVNGGDVARGAFGSATDAMSGLFAGNGVVASKAAQAALGTGTQVTRNQLAKAVVVATTKNTVVQTGAELGLKTTGIAMNTSLTDKQKRNMVSQNAMQTVKGLPVQLVTGGVSGYGGIALQLKKPVADVAAQLVFDGATNLAQASANNYLNKGDARLSRDDIVVASIQAVGGAGQNIAGRVQMKPTQNSPTAGQPLPQNGNGATTTGGAGASTPRNIATANLPDTSSQRSNTPGKPVQTASTQTRQEVTGNNKPVPGAASKSEQKLLAPGKNETQQIYGPDGKKIGSTYVANNGSITGTRGENNQVFSAGRPDYGVVMSTAAVPITKTVTSTNPKDGSQSTALLTSYTKGSMTRTESFKLAATVLGGNNRSYGNMNTKQIRAVLDNADVVLAVRNSADQKFGAVSAVTFNDRNRALDYGMPPNSTYWGQVVSSAKDPNYYYNPTKRADQEAAAIAKGKPLKPLPPSAVPMHDWEVKSVVNGAVGYMLPEVITMAKENNQARVFFYTTDPANIKAYSGIAQGQLSAGNINDWRMTVQSSNDGKVGYNYELILNDDRAPVNSLRPNSLQDVRNAGVTIPEPNAIGLPAAPFTELTTRPDWDAVDMTGKTREQFIDATRGARNSQQFTWRDPNNGRQFEMRGDVTLALPASRGESADSQNTATGTIGAMSARDPRTASEPIRPGAIDMTGRPYEEFAAASRNAREEQQFTWRDPDDGTLLQKNGEGQLALPASESAPINIMGRNGQQTGTIQRGNNGSLTITEINPATGQNMVTSPNSSSSGPVRTLRRDDAPDSPTRVIPVRSVNPREVSGRPQWDAVDMTGKSREQFIEAARGARNSQQFIWRDPADGRLFEMRGDVTLALPMGVGPFQDSIGAPLKATSAPTLPGETRRQRQGAEFHGARTNPMPIGSGTVVADQLNGRSPDYVGTGPIVSSPRGPVRQQLDSAYESARKALEAYDKTYDLPLKKLGEMVGGKAKPQPTEAEIIQSGGLPAAAPLVGVRARVGAGLQGLANTMTGAINDIFSPIASTLKRTETPQQKRLTDGISWATNGVADGLSQAQGVVFNRTTARIMAATTQAGLINFGGNVAAGNYKAYVNVPTSDVPQIASVLNLPPKDGRFTGITLDPKSPVDNFVGVGWRLPSLTDPISIRESTISRGQATSGTTKNPMYGKTNVARVMEFTGGYNFGNAIAGARGLLNVTIGGAAANPPYLTTGNVSPTSPDRVPAIGSAGSIAPIQVTGFAGVVTGPVVPALRAAAGVEGALGTARSTAGGNLALGTYQLPAQGASPAVLSNPAWSKSPFGKLIDNLITPPERRPMEFPVPKGVNVEATQGTTSRPVAPDLSTDSGRKVVSAALNSRGATLKVTATPEQIVAETRRLTSEGRIDGAAVSRIGGGKLNFGNVEADVLNRYQTDRRDAVFSLLKSKGITLDPGVTSPKALYLAIAALAREGKVVGGEIIKAGDGIYNFGNSEAAKIKSDRK